MYSQFRILKKNDRDINIPRYYSIHREMVMKKKSVLLLALILGLSNMAFAAEAPNEGEGTEAAATIEEEIGAPTGRTFQPGQFLKAAEMFDDAKERNDVDTMEAIIAHFKAAGGRMAVHRAAIWQKELRALQGEGEEVPARPVKKAKPAKKPSKKKPSKKVAPKKVKKPAKKVKKTSKKPKKAPSKKAPAVPPLRNLSTMSGAQLIKLKRQLEAYRDTLSDEDPRAPIIDQQVDDIETQIRTKGFRPAV